MHTIIALALLTLSISAFACERSFDKFLCPNDYVSSDGGWSGRVQGINPLRRTAAVNWHRNQHETTISLTSIVAIPELYINRGCLENYCVGDLVGNASGWTGRIVAVNPYNDKLTIRWSQNQHATSVVLRSTSVKTDLTLGHGCVKSYCVGDTVTNLNGWTGTIVSVGRFKDNATVRWLRNQYGTRIGGLRTVDLETLANSEFCAQYGQAERSAPYYFTRTQYRDVERLEGFENEFYIGD